MVLFRTIPVRSHQRHFNKIRVLFFVILISFSCILVYFYPTRNICSQSLIESDQLFCESNEKWQKRREFYMKEHEKNILTMNEYENYFKENWSPEFQCQNEIRLGQGDGGKWVHQYSLILFHN